MNDRKHVLIIEDNHDMRVCLRQHLEDSGYGVCSVANGKDALSLLEQGFIPNLIILDLNMPLMNGEEFLLASQKNSSFDDIPVIIVSGESDKSALLGKPCIEKPVNWNRLTEEVQAQVD